MKQLRGSILLLTLLLAISPAWAQQKSSKSKSADKIYEKGEINPNVVLKNTVMINTENLEFSPVFYQNGIVYVSSRHKSGAVDKKIGETFFELFYAELDKQGTPLQPEEFSINVNSQVHEGPVSFNRSGDIIYFTRNNMKNGIRQADSRGITRLKIYEARRGRFDWENVQELPFNNDEYSVCHPSLSADNRRLYFTSDMPGGYGGFDLYMVEKRGDIWGTPINLGPEINSSGNEVFPFIHESGTLFFSSDGHGGYGGLDMFMIDLSSQNWGKVSNLGMPFNSPLDDLGFILDPNGEYGFFTSDRAGGYGKDDIYRFELPDGLQGMRSGMQLAAQVIVYDKQTNQRIPGAQVRVFEREADGFIQGNDLYDVQLLPSSPGSNELVLKLVRKNADNLGEPSLVTDANGEAYYRLKSERNYLLLVTKDGYASGEVVYSTAGESGPQTIRVPIGKRTCAKLDGLVSIDPQGDIVSNAVVRIVNSETQEEKMLKTDEEGRFDYCLDLGYDYMVYAEKEGYAPGSNRISTVGIRQGTERTVTVNLRLNPIADNFDSRSLKEGSVIVLENIYYDFNKSAIRTGAARELDALATLMKQFPSMEIEMVAHTDSRGSEEYNLKLSLKRAESAKRYLVSQGIEAKRIRALGYGESKLRNDCADGVNCSEEEHQYNRRTEVRVARLDAPVRLKYQESDPFKN